jgi:hypothetical protein
MCRTEPLSEGTPNTFKPSSTIEFGQKYQFEISGAKIEVKFHSPDAVAAAKFPGSTSGSQWTSQIKVDGALLGADPVQEGVAREYSTSAGLPDRVC